MTGLARLARGPPHSNQADSRPVNLIEDLMERSPASRLGIVAIDPEGRLDMSESLDSFDLRAGFLAAEGVDVGAIVFSTAFGRRLDYYTGFMFELHASTHEKSQPLVGGGRYDRLIAQLGAITAAAEAGLKAHDRWLNQRMLLQQLVVVWEAAQLCLQASSNCALESFN